LHTLRTITASNGLGPKTDPGILH